MVPLRSARRYTGAHFTGGPMRRAACLALLATVTLAGCKAAPSVPTFRPVVLDAATARTIDDFPRHLTTYRLPSEHTAGAISMVEVTIPPHTLGAPPHVHGDEDEFFYVLEGDVSFRSDDSVSTHGPGSVAALPRGHLHCFWNATDRPARLLVTVVPGRFDKFFDEAAAEIRAEHPDDPQKVGEIVTRVAKRYGIEVFGDQVPDMLRKYGLH